MTKAATGAGRAGCSMARQTARNPMCIEGWLCYCKCQGSRRWVGGLGIWAVLTSEQVAEGKNLWLGGRMTCVWSVVWLDD